jgi:hypothetical protein
VRTFRGIARPASALKTRAGVGKVAVKMQRSARDMDSIIPQFTSVLCHEYYLPLHDSHEFVGYRGVGHVACVPSTRIFLARCLGKVHPETFGLLNLPKELRLTVYELALTLPQLLYRKNSSAKASTGSEHLRRPPIRPDRRCVARVPPRLQAERKAQCFHATVRQQADPRRSHALLLRRQPLLFS